MAQRISVIVEANDAGLSTGMRRAASTVDEFGQRTDRAGKTVTRASNEMKGAFTQLENVVSRVSGRALAQFAVRALGVYAAGRAVNQALTSVIGGAVQFDAKMRNVNSISYLTDQQLGHLSAQVLNLSRTLPQSANTLAAGLYDIASSGFQGAQGVTVLTAAARAATAGLTDTATSAAAIAGVLNAYGKNANQARTVSDSLFQTVNLGVLSFGDLAQGIGQVVGTASAAGVNIDQLGQAIATMTKAGIVPAEAFTSLNQVLAQIIQPSDALSAVFKHLGYQSGAAALQSKGLDGVMRDIQRTTGGNVTTMAELFTDMRALRGALALTTDQGKLYSGVIRDWGAAHKGAGATSAALAEQMKSVSAQWQLFKNRVQAAAIETGTKLLPALLATMRGTQDFGQSLGSVLHDVGPTFHNLADAGVSLVRIIVTLASAALPLAKVLAAIVAVPIIATIEGLSKALAATLGFLANNKVALAAVAAVLTVALIPALITATAQAGLFTANLAAAGILKTLDAVSALSTAVAGLGVAGGIAVAASAAVGAAMYLLWTNTTKAEKQAKDAADGFFASLSVKSNSIPSITSGIASLRDRIGEVADAGRHAGDVTRFGLVGDKTQIQVDQLNGHLGDLNKRLRELQAQQGQVDSNSRRIAASLGLSTTAVEKYAAANNIDLTGSWNGAADGVRKVTVGLKGLAGQAGVTLPQLLTETDGSIEAMQALADATKKAGDATRQAFAGSFDVIQQFDPKAGADEISSAQQKLIDAQRSLREETARYDAQKTHSVSSDQQLARARRGVADATTGLRDAQSKAAASSDLAAIYRRDIHAAENFVTEIDAAVRRGLDPNEVARLLQAGPEKATPILDALVRDHSNRLIRLSNQSERALSAISERAVEASRLTTRAISADSDKLAHDLPNAMKIDQVLAATAGKGVLAFLKQMHLKPSEIQRIATEFGITLPRAIQSALDNHPVRVNVGRLPAGLRQFGVGAGSGSVVVPHGAAGGGHITGPGTATSDSIPAWLSNGEYVVKAAAVNHYGAGVMHALNAMRMPRFAAGGLAVGNGPQRASAPIVIVRGGDGGGVSHKTEINVGEVRAHDYSDFLQQMDGHRRIAAVTP